MFLILISCLQLCSASKMRKSQITYTNSRCKRRIKVNTKNIEIVDSEFYTQYEFDEIRIIFEEFKADVEKYHSSMDFIKDCKKRYCKNKQYQNSNYKIFMAEFKVNQNQSIINTKNHWKVCNATNVKDDIGIIKLKKAGVNIIEFYSRLIIDETSNSEIMYFNYNEDKVRLYMQRLKSKKEDSSIRNLYEKISKKYCCKLFDIYQVIVSRNDFLYGIFPFLLPLEEVLVNLEFDYNILSIEDVIEVVGWLHIINLHAQVYFDYYKKNFKSISILENSNMQNKNMGIPVLFLGYTQYKTDIEVAFEKIILIALRMPENIGLKKIFFNFALLRPNELKMSLFKDIVFIGNLNQNNKIIEKYNQCRLRETNFIGIRKNWFYTQVIAYVKSIYNGTMFYEKSPTIWMTIIRNIEELIQLRNTTLYIDLIDIELYTKLKDYINKSILWNLTFYDKIYLKKK